MTYGSISARFGVSFCEQSNQEDLRFVPLIEWEGFKMSTGSSGWHMDPGPPVWDAAARTFSFYLHKRGCERVLCVLTIDALEGAIQSSDLSDTALSRIFEAHRLMIELRAAQKLNARLREPDGSVLVSANDI